MFKIDLSVYFVVLSLINDVYGNIIAIKYKKSRAYLLMVYPFIIDELKII